MRRLASGAAGAPSTASWSARVEAVSRCQVLSCGGRSPNATIFELLGECRAPSARQGQCHAGTTSSPRTSRTRGQEDPTRFPTPSTSTSTSAPCREQRGRIINRNLREEGSELYDQVEISICGIPTPRGRIRRREQLSDTLATHTQVAYPNAKLIPGLIVGGTDARFYRRRGKIAYGAGLFSPPMDFASFGTRFHGNDGASTPSPSACRPSTSTASPRNCSADPSCRVGAWHRRDNFSGRGRVRSRAGRGPSRPCRRRPVVAADHCDRDTAGVALDQFGRGGEFVDDADLLDPELGPCGSTSPM